MVSGLPLSPGVVIDFTIGRFVNIRIALYFVASVDVITAGIYVEIANVG